MKKLSEIDGVVKVILYHSGHRQAMAYTSRSAIPIAVGDVEMALKQGALVLIRDMSYANMSTYRPPKPLRFS